MTCKTFLECYTKLNDKLIFANATNFDSVDGKDLLQQNYKALKWQIWRCVLGWFLLRVTSVLATNHR